jgi:hypothetical protein
MRTFVIGLVVGTAALSAVLYAAALALGVVADSNGFASFEWSLGPVTLFAFERAGRSTAMTVGAGLALIALAGGVLNGAAATWLHRRRNGKTGFVATSTGRAGAA